MPILKIGNNLPNSISRVKDVIRLQEPLVRNLALDLGLLEGHLDYVRFIILGRSRTGSNLLRGMLNSHSRVTTFGEIFQSRDVIAWGLPNYPQSKRALALFQSDPARFLETHVFRKVPVKTKAVGFKIFYYHAQADPGKAVWAYLKNNLDIRVIHIKRANILRTHLSRARAARTDQWVDLSGDPQQELPIELNYEECRMDFVRTREWEKEYALFFNDHPQIEVFYEELSNDYPKEMNRIQEFLSLDEEPVAPQTHKQSCQSLSQAISNYFELKQQFAHSCWQEFFDE